MNDHRHDELRMDSAGSQLRAWMRSTAPTSEPEGMVAAAIERTGSIRQRPAFVARLRVPKPALGLSDLSERAQLVLVAGLLVIGAGAVTAAAARVLNLTTPSVVTASPTPAAQPTSSAPAPAGPSRGLIVLSGDGGDGTIKIIRTDGVVVGVVRGSTNGCDRLVLSADGKRVAFVFQGPPVTIVSLDGSDRLRVPQSGPTVSGSAFSPDRTRFAYLAGTSERSDLTIVSLIDGSATVIARDLHGATLSWSGWSVDDTLAIGVVSETEIGVDLIGADGTNLRSLARQPRGEGSIRDGVMVSWSADGARLAYAGGETPGPSETRVVDIATGRSIVVATADGKPVAAWASVANTGHFLWSPDGRQVSYETNDRYALLELETGQSRIVADALWMPFWSPDGSRLAFQGQGGPGHLTTFRADLSGRVDQVVEEEITAIAWSPDSRQIAVLSGSAIDLLDAAGIEPRIRIATDMTPGCLTWFDVDTK